jgi:ABC-2 type transport system permease protein
VIRAFLYLTGCSFKNRVRRRLRRLRQPRYVAGLAVGLLYLYWFVIRNQMRSGRRGGLPLDPASLAPVVPEILAAGGLILWVVALVTWLVPSSGPPLKFNGPEECFLFTAPVPRRTLVNYKLVRSQAGLAFGVLIALLFSGAATAAARGRWSFAVGGWMLLTTIFLHALGIRLARAGLRAPARLVPWFSWLPMVLMGGVSGLVIGGIGVHLPRLLSMAPDDALTAVRALAAGGVASAALWPFKAAIAPMFSLSLPAFAAAGATACALLALNYWWVLEAASRIDGSVALAEKAQAGRATPIVSAGARRQPFSLDAGARPEVAILWKNLILFGRYLSFRTIVRVLVPIVVLAAVLGTSRRGGAAGLVVAVVAGFITVMGPYMVTNDLRHDLPRLAVIKTWPVRGSSLLVGELLAPTLALSVIVWFLLALAVALSSGWRQEWGSVGTRVALALSAAVLAPGLIVGQLLVQNAAVILFPGWIPTGGARPRGIEAMGQNMLMFAGTFLALAVGVLPAAAVGGGLGFVLYQFVGVAGLLPAGLLVAAILALEAGLVIAVLGRVLDRIEPSQVEVAE